MTVLITGATGFVGGHIVDRLVSRSAAVRALVRQPSADLEAAGVECLVGDVRDSEVVSVATKGVDTVFHAASVGQGAIGDLWNTNVEGTRAVMHASVENDVRRVVHLSTETVYRAPMPRSIDEDHPTGGLELYGRSKTAAESIVRKVCGQRVEHVILRPCQIYGSCDRSGHTDMLFDLASRRPVLVPRGNSLFSLVHITDVVDAIEAAATVPAAAGCVFNIAGPARTSLRELAEVLPRDRQRTRRKVVIPRSMLRAALIARWAVMALRNPNVRPFWRSYAPTAVHGSIWLGGPEYDTKRAREVLGYIAKVDPAEGVQRVLGGG